jgi:alkylation response protein AidB-like acyl-CoA dehydrogenase
MPRIQAGELRGGTAQLFTERTGGSDLAEMETTAEPDGDAYRLNGLKWFASNADGEAYIVMAKPIGAADNLRGAASFLVLKERRDGGRNGIRIRQLKDKLGTKSVASAEVEFVDAEAFLLSGDSPGEAGAAGDGRGASRLMEMTNGARMGVAMMGLGCARRSLVESICYAGAREAFRGRLVDHPLVKRKLAEMMVEVEAVQAMVFDRSLQNHQRKSKEIEQLRLAPAVVKLRAARLGITMAGDAMEIFGGNGYVETWPIARILRDAHVNSIWEGADNILCLDVRRAIEREEADVPFMERIEEAIDNAGESSPATRFVADRAEDLRRALRAWKDLERTTAEARLFPLSQFMGEVYAGALLVEQAEWEQRQSGSDRKALVARLFAERHLAAPDPLRGMASRDESVDRFDDLLAGAFLDETAPL